MQEGEWRHLRLGWRLGVEGEMEIRGEEEEGRERVQRREGLFL